MYQSIVGFYEGVNILLMGFSNELVTSRHCASTNVFYIHILWYVHVRTVFSCCLLPLNFVTYLCESITIMFKQLHRGCLTSQKQL